MTDDHVAALNAHCMPRPPAPSARSLHCACMYSVCAVRECFSRRRWTEVHAEGLGAMPPVKIALHHSSLSSTVRPLKEATSTASCSPVSSSYWTSGTVATVEARRQSHRHSEQSTVALRKQSEKTFRGSKHIDLTQQGNCLRQSLALQPTPAITRFDIRRNRSRETFRLKILSHSRSANPAFLPIEENMSDRKTLSFSHTLFLWFWAFQGNKQCTCSHDKQSASLYTDMLHSLTQRHAHTAWRSA